MKTQFVNITLEADKLRATALPLSPPAEYLEFRTAVENILSYLRTGKVCGACFAGRLRKEYKRHGCCGSCPALSTEGCTSKPAMCALYTCDFLGKLFGNKLYSDWHRLLTNQFQDIRHSLKKDRWSTNPYFINGYIDDSQLEYTPETLLQLKKLTRRAELILARIKRGYYEISTPEQVIEAFRSSEVKWAKNRLHNARWWRNKRKAQKARERREARIANAPQVQATA